MSVCKCLVHALVTSRLDYGIAMLFGKPDRLMHRLDRVQRSAARVGMQLRRDDRRSITAVLQHLRWLPVRKRIEYKLLMVVHMALYAGTPVYLASLLHRHPPRRTLRSGGGLLLDVPRVNLVVVMVIMVVMVVMVVMVIGRLLVLGQHCGTLCHWNYARSRTPGSLENY